ncbi:hypothetical protein LguiA_007223 [Lonicera macranthoides]
MQERERHRWEREAREKERHWASERIEKKKERSRWESCGEEEEEVDLSAPIPSSSPTLSYSAALCLWLWREYFVNDLIVVGFGTKNIKGILLHPSHEREYTIEMPTEAFRKMAKLRLLEIHNTCIPKGPDYLPNELRWIDWDKYPSNSLPTTFEADILVGLRLRYSRLKQLWEGRTLDLTDCNLLASPDGLGSLFSLKELHLGGNKFENLPNLNQLSQLAHLELNRCEMLRELPELPSGIRRLFANDCRAVNSYSGILENIILPGRAIPGWFRNHTFTGHSALLELPQNPKIKGYSFFVILEVVKKVKSCKLAEFDDEDDHRGHLRWSGLRHDGPITVVGVELSFTALGPGHSIQQRAIYLRDTDNIIGQEHMIMGYRTSDDFHSCIDCRWEERREIASFPTICESHHLDVIKRDMKTSQLGMFMVGFNEQFGSVPLEINNWVIFEDDELGDPITTQPESTS